jgi:hypothetical protein
MRIAFAAIAVALAVIPPAFAHHPDPKRAITSADRKRSRAQSIFTVIAVVGTASIDSVRISRVIAARMTVAMRGG